MQELLSNEDSKWCYEDEAYYILTASCYIQKVSLFLHTSYYYFILLHQGNFSHQVTSSISTGFIFRRYGLSFLQVTRRVSAIFRRLT